VRDTMSSESDETQQYSPVMQSSLYSPYACAQSDAPRPSRCLTFTSVSVGPCSAQRRKKSSALKPSREPSYDSFLPDWHGIHEEARSFSMSEMM
jgi:hypothetical protein